ncbi:hypothetical protein OsI_35240 [Oryza sativa Indica Group]|uniref:Uncharacterized protein n=1 Tax=Oryza sativa subsp. indica TaxID=39946 RepID=B8BJA2_ORYSI|nr:hypothetical protein OsI_35240 [Oryza sativa Indica Group]
MSPDSYCVWVSSPSPASSPSRPPRKNGSTGSITRWRRISELVIGRNHSDGKEKFRFLSALSSPAREHPKPKPTTKGATATKPQVAAYLQGWNLEEVASLPAVDGLFAAPP